VDVDAGPFGHHEDRAPTHGYAPTREAAMAGARKLIQVKCEPIDKE
jgi:hypothetical protein